jgi:hypothetical protein
MIKCLENLLKKLRALKYTQPIQSNLDSINLLIIRDTFTENSTIGELFLNGERMCDTLENPYINNERKISCIPEGKYKVRLRLPRESATRDYLHLLVQDVPNRDWILFHRGNSAKDTSGCILNLGGTNINLIIKNR